MTLGRRDIDRVRRTVQDYEHRSGQVNTKTDNRIPAATVAKADADIAALASGTFTLQKLKPDALLDSATKRDAYALSAIRLGELVTLNWYVGEASQGFWAASTISPSESIESCVCLISQILQDNLTLTDAETASLAAECDMCDTSVPPPTVSDCSGCDIREDFLMSFAGWSDTTYTTTFIDPDDYVVDLKLSQLNGQTLLWDDIQSNTLGCAYRHTSSPFADLSFDAIPRTSAASIGLGATIDEPTPFEYFAQNVVGDRVNANRGGALGWALDMQFRDMVLFDAPTTGIFPGCTPTPPDQIGHTFLWNGQPSETVGSGDVTYS